jgi:NADPH:quinone reductase-like Zn-dependent oxidoreductase
LTFASKNRSPDLGGGEIVLKRLRRACAVGTTFLLTVVGPLAAAAVPTEQQAVVQHGFGGPEVLRLQNIPVLQPRAGQVLIEVYAAAVNPVDWKIRREGVTEPLRRGVPEPMSIPGSDVAGVVAGVGSDVSNVRVGEAVFASVGGQGTAGLNGGYAHYTLASAATVQLKPVNSTYEQAAGLGMAAMTGVRADIVAQVAAGERILVTGAAGGVGSSAAQVAVARGATVIGTASPEHAHYLRRIGVSEVVDDSHKNWTTEVRNVDIAIDTVGGDTAEQALGTVKKGGAFLSVAAKIDPADCASRGVNCLPGGPLGRNGPTLAALMQRVEELAVAGKLLMHVSRTFPIEHAAEAQEYNRQGHTEGKVILVMSPKAQER